MSKEILQKTVDEMKKDISPEQKLDAINKAIDEVDAQTYQTEEEFTKVVSTLRDMMNQLGTPKNRSPDSNILDKGKSKRNVAKEENSVTQKVSGMTIMVGEKDKPLVDIADIDAFGQEDLNNLQIEFAALQYEIAILQTKGFLENLTDDEQIYEKKDVYKKMLDTYKQAFNNLPEAALHTYPNPVQKDFYIEVNSSIIQDTKELYSQISTLLNTNEIQRPNRGKGTTIVTETISVGAIKPLSELPQIDLGGFDADKITNSIESNIQLVDMQGKTLSRGIERNIDREGDQKIHIDMANLPNGTYYIQFPWSMNGQTITRKLIKSS